MRIDILSMVFLLSRIIIDNVSINGEGRYRFLIDTGSQSTMIDASVARKLSLTAAYRVSLDTPAGSRIVPAANTLSVSAGTAHAENIEVLWYDFNTERSALGDIHGILGNNFLSRFDYILDFKNRTLLLRPQSGFAESIRGERIPFHLDEGRIVVPVRFAKDGLPHDFILDSGATTMILPEALADTLALRSKARLHTTAGIEDVAVTDVPCIFVGKSAVRNLPAAIQRTSLLPAHIFESIYVNSARGYLVLNPEF
jgi:predicted aspartyl protease